MPNFSKPPSDIEVSQPDMDQGESFLISRKIFCCEAVIIALRSVTHAQPKTILPAQHSPFFSQYGHVVCILFQASMTVLFQTSRLLAFVSSAAGLDFFGLIVGVYAGGSILGGCSEVSVKGFFISTSFGADTLVLTTTISS